MRFRVEWKAFLGIFGIVVLRFSLDSVVLCIDASDEYFYKLKICSCQLIKFKYSTNFAEKRSTSMTSFQMRNIEE